MSNQFIFHHVGVAVAELEPAIAFYQNTLGLELIGEPVTDPIQKVTVCFLAEPGKKLTHLELICPASEDSPIKRYLKADIGAYHVCYEVPDIDAALAHLREAGSFIISKPVPATAFASRKIAWCYTPTNQLVELLELESK